MLLQKIVYWYFMFIFWLAKSVQQMLFISLYYIAKNKDK